MSDTTQVRDAQELKKAIEGGARVIEVQAPITTTGDGSLGIQMSKPLPHLEVTGDVTTSGGEGSSLVRSVQVVLKAIALSVKETGEVGTLRVGGALRTSGSEVATLEVAGRIASLSVDGGISAADEGSDGVHLTGDGVYRAGVVISAVAAWLTIL
ncbi:hypothetical protein [Corynebacterium senegalense]|uniref:hypothetical protein n=1 Tax=Corynebacterium senegalense TaxID=2080750 RepID=UPI0015F29A10|nr:hypothetical protein [Corynebacterium senegalense]